MRFTTQLLPSRSGNLGVLLLNNPKPFHALTLEMIMAFQDVLNVWYQDDSLQAILVKSSRECKKPAFCAGGDVKRVYMSCVQDNDEGVVHGVGTPGLASAEFFRQEYLVNHAMATARQPQISLWDGIVMGGGVGISIFGKYRVATENTLFAMPETGIGLFPDVGSMYWMPRLLSETSGMAAYLALTGKRLRAADLLYVGLATHYVPSLQLDDLERALVTATEKLKPTATAETAVAPVLLSFHQTPATDPEQSDVAIQKENIRKVFGPVIGNPQHTVETICEDLKQLENDFGQETLETLAKVSPTSLKVTLEGLRRGSQATSIGEDLRMEFRMSQHFMKKGSDFREGIRAALVDKDGNPQWKPSKLEDVTKEMVNSYFEPIEYEWEIPDITTSSKL
jgi:enoyl-CoA hydratase/carnithine racemase